MPVQLDWDTELTEVMYFIYSDPITPQEILDSQTHSIELLDSVEHPIDAIIDMREVKRVPKGLLSSYPSFAGHPARKHPNNGRLVCIINSRMIESLAGIFGKVYTDFRIVTTLEEAYEILKD